MAQDNNTKSGGNSNTFIIIFAVIVVIISVSALGLLAYVTFFNEEGEGNDPITEITESITDSIEELQNQEFRAFGLTTNTTNSLIDLDLVLSGGPGKDGIPAINEPNFLSIDQASGEVEDEFDGILLDINGETKFYPFNVLVWHEIVNDTVGGEEVSVTFCPLCGSSIVFNRNVEGEVLQFGVSGLLYESNLLMYDTATESLWSQIEGRAVIGEKSGLELEIVDAEVVTFADLKVQYPDAQVLSQDTGFSRNYNFYPYGDYESNNGEFIFPVTYLGEQADIEAKEIVIASTVQDIPVAFAWNDLREAGTAQISTDEGVVTATFDNGDSTITDSEGNEYPIFFTMWFSWANHNLAEGVNTESSGQFWFNQ